MLVLSQETNVYFLSSYLYLKGLCHKMNTLFEGLNILINAQGGFQGLKSLLLPCTIIEYLFASLKLLTNFETY
jgi:hypothetical protein